VSPPLADRRHAARPPLADRLHAARVIAGRDLLGLAASPGPYAALTLAMLATLVIVRGHLDALARGQLLILADAFTLPYFVAATVAMLFLALSSAATVARERDHGTLETLFYGPVDAPSYVLAKHAAQVGAFALMGLAAAGLLLGYAGLTGLRIGGTFPLALLLSLASAAAVAALGVALSTLTRSVRSAFGLFVLVTALLLAVRLGADLLAGTPVDNNQSPLLFARDLFVALDALAARLSPFALFQDGVDAAVRGDPAGYLSALAVACVHCLALLWAAVRLLERRGVRR
jgi:ABC-type Na+ efflux pump permease subunit